MTLEEIQRWVMEARPGTTIQIVSIQVPLDARTTSEPCDGAHGVEGPWTTEQVVEWVRREYGEAGLKPREWSALLPGISARELRLAIRAGSMKYYQKAEGRDHGAYLVGPDAMYDYLHGRSRAGVGSPAPRGERR